MITHKLLAFMAAGLFAASSALAGDKECCAGHASNDMKGKCEATFAKLDLNAAQRAKMVKLAAECDKGGCDSESMARMEKKAKGILSNEQFAAWKAACSQEMSKKS